MRIDQLKINDRVRNIFGFTGTVITLYPEEGLAQVRFDEERRGRVVGRDWHCNIADLTEA